MTVDIARKSIQSILGGIAVDGEIGAHSMARLDLLRAAPADSEWPPIAIEHTGQASSFADPADVEAFNRCKATGKSDEECFAVGDNGIGEFGGDTAQTVTPMCALHRDDMIAEWGSVAGSAHQLVRVTANGKAVTCAVEDRCGVKGRIDLNPSAALALGLTPPFLVAATWQRT